jgi:lipopolysaccharide/colanic/teichoic acid biosynthesis glycosyltransferase
VAALIKVNSKGPVFLRQCRVGRNGEPFLMWKFRSMYVDAPLYARSPTTDRDPRLTKFGRSLRRYSLDELPQLWNVLKGEMSLVGPRPEMPFIAKEYGDYERLRLNATPGITGLWQISPARAMPIHENLELDLYYIGHRSFFLDLAILIRTVTAVLRGIGAR